MQHRGDRPGAVERPAGDRVERVLDPAAADLVRTQRLQQGGPLRVVQVPGERPLADPLPDGLVDPRDREFPPERLGERQQVTAIGGAVLRGLDLLQGGQLRVVLRHGPGEHGLPRGPVPHPVRLRRGPRHRQRRGPVTLPEQVPGPLDGLAGEGLALGPGHARRVRRAGHHVRGVLLATAGHAHVEHLRFMPADTTSRAVSTVMPWLV